MKTIYKSIALEAALLSVTIALQAEIQSEGETVTADVQASSLDRLKVTLVSPNVSGARDLVASGNATIDDNEIAVNLENLTFGTHRLVVSARFGTQIRTLYALDISVPRAELPNETQEYEDAAIVVSTYGDGGGGEFPTDYAKQGDDPTATLTDAQAYAQAAAEAAQSLTSLDSDINAGKTAIAQAVTAKGVPTSPTDTMLQMATNVTQIAQAPISINGGEMYAKQLYGSLTTPNYWNLYEVMAQLLSDGRLNNYGGILLAEYYKGYDSLALSGAGAGGAYVVSDVDSNGNFILYTEDTTHVWDTEDDGKGNRWVAYCFADAGHDFEITDTNTSPRMIIFGRSVGTIRLLTDSRISDIIRFDDNSTLGGIVTNNYSSNWSPKQVMRGLNSQSAVIYRGGNAINSIYIDANNIVNTSLVHLTSSGDNSLLSSVIVKCKNVTNSTILEYNYNKKYANLGCIFIDGVESCNGRLGIVHIDYSLPDFMLFDNLQNISIINTEEISLLINPQSTSTYPKLRSIYFGYKTNDKTKSCSIVSYQSNFSYIQNLTDITLQNGWCKPINIAVATMLTEANMYAHILQRLKQDEADCGDGVTITLGQTNLDKLTSQESVDLLDTLTNTYGYTFA